MPKLKLRKQPKKKELIPDRAGPMFMNFCPQCHSPGCEILESQANGCNQHQECRVVFVTALRCRETICGFEFTVALPL